MKIEMMFEVSETRASRWWEAESKCSWGKGYGAGSSMAVAVARAAQNLMRAKEETQTDVEEEQAALPYTPTHWVNAGRHEGQKCMVRATVAILGSGVEVYSVEYEDGTAGEEKNRFLRPIGAVKR